MFNSQFNCKKCPKNSDPDKGPFCPAWFSGDHEGRQLTEKNKDGDERMLAGCFYKVMPFMLYRMWQRVDSGVAEVSAMRSENNRDAVQAVHLMGHMVGSLAPREAQPRLSHDDSD